jgi:hypothetical protein
VNRADAGVAVTEAGRQEWIPAPGDGAFERALKERLVSIQGYREASSDPDDRG